MAGEAAKRKRREGGQGPEVPAGMELRKDGTVLFHVGGEMLRLRRPTIGELRKLREGVAERDAKLAEAQAKVRDDAPAEKGEEDPAGALQAMGEAAITVADLQRDLNLEWVLSAVRVLADKEPPPTDDWPSGMDETGALTGLLRHWREVPLRSGAS